MKEETNQISAFLLKSRLKGKQGLLGSSLEKRGRVRVGRAIHSVAFAQCLRSNRDSFLETRWWF